MCCDSWKISHRALDSVDLLATIAPRILSAQGLSCVVVLGRVSSLRNPWFWIASRINQVWFVLSAWRWRGKFWLVAVVEQLKRTPVKRHHSTGDMLDERACVAPAHSDSDEEDDVRLRLRKYKPRRPKSEGNFIVEGFIPRRASSFGVSPSLPLPSPPSISTASVLKSYCC